MCSNRPAHDSPCHQEDVLEKVSVIETFFRILFPSQRGLGRGYTLYTFSVRSGIFSKVSLQPSKFLHFISLCPIHTSALLSHSFAAQGPQTAKNQTTTSKGPMHQGRFSRVLHFATPWTVCSPSGSSVHGILQVRMLEWVAIPSSRGPSCAMRQRKR